MIEYSPELIKRLNDLKKHTFFEILDLVDRVFIIVDYNENVIIGKRGFLPEEKERGLVLVFNSQMKFQWDDEALLATLVFGGAREKCYIPINSIAAVFSPELRVQLTVPVLKLINSEEPSDSLKKDISEEDKISKIINLSDFRKKK